VFYVLNNGLELEISEKFFQGQRDFQTKEKVLQ